MIQNDGNYIVIENTEQEITTELGISRALEIPKQHKVDSYKITKFMKSSGLIGAIYIRFYNENIPVVAITLYNAKNETRKIPKTYRVGTYRDHFPLASLNTVRKELKRTNLLILDSMTKQAMKTYRKEWDVRAKHAILDLNNHYIFGIKSEQNPIRHYEKILGKIGKHWDASLSLPILEIARDYDSAGTYKRYKNKITIDSNLSTRSMGFVLLHESAHWIQRKMYDNFGEKEVHNLLFRQILYCNWKHILGVKAAHALRESFNSNPNTQGVVASFEEFIEIESTISNAELYEKRNRIII